MRRTVLLTALTLLFSFVVFADEPQWTISPSSGSVTGGTKVTIKGSFGSWPYSVDFGGVSASATRVDDQTLVAVTPEHVAGIVDVRIFEYDIYITPPGLTFEFIGNPTREQYLLPVFIEPVQGAHGSEFRTELRGVNTSPNEGIDIWGLENECRYTPPVCNWLQEPMVQLAPTPSGADLIDYTVYQTGTPGRFIEVPREHAEQVSLTLKVYDTSRSAENYGTEIPIVRTTEFTRKPFALLGVPRDPRYRNTLRLYATGPTTVRVSNDVDFEPHTLTLPAGEHVFDPAYAQFTTFPTGNGVMRVYIEPAENGPAVWGFISVTNNDTQHITTITPR